MVQPLDAATRIFQYPQQIHIRRHGPLGYVNYQSYKPWLRDEFQFRCVYCLWRERWLAVGEEAFSVEHLVSRSVAPERSGDYENLVYACCRCNSVKTDAHYVLDPCQQPLGRHLQIAADGAIRGLTSEGRELIQICRLDRPRITQARKRLLDLFQALQESATPRASELLQHYLGFPDNLPLLSHYRPPGGNSRPEGIGQSCSELRKHGQLPATY
jgi:hypothetical protein